MKPDSMFPGNMCLQSVHATPPSTASLSVLAGERRKGFGCGHANAKLTSACNPISSQIQVSVLSWPVHLKANMFPTSH